MATDIPAVEQLTAKIHELQGDETRERLSPLLEYSGSSLVGRIVAGADQDSIEAVFGLLGSVEGAISRIPSSRIRSPLGENAMHAVIGSFHERDSRPKAGEATVTLLEQAGRFAGLIGEPRDQAFCLARVARDAAGAALVYGTDSRATLMTLSDTLIGQAAEAAGHVAKPDRKASAYMRTAETAAENLAGVADKFAGVQGGEELLERLAGRPGALFGEASKVAQKLKDPKERASQQIALATAEAAAAGAVGEANPELCRELVDMTLAEIDNLSLIDAEGWPTSLSAGQKAGVLVRLGAGLAKSADYDYWPSHQSVTQRQRLVEETVKVFEAAKVYAAQATSPEGRRFFRSTRESLGSISLDANAAGGRFLQHDFPAAKEILGYAYDLAVAEDIEDGGGGYRKHAQEAARDITEFARKRKSVDEAFSLFALAHDKEYGPAIQEGHIHALAVNARAFLAYVQDSVYAEDVAFDELKKPFVEFAVDVGIASMSSHNWTPELSKLARCVRDPALKKTINERVDKVRKERQQEQAPQSDLERLARLALGRS